MTKNLLKTNEMVEHLREWKKTNPIVYHISISESKTNFQQIRHF